RSRLAALCGAVRADANSIEARDLVKTFRLDRGAARTRLEWQARAQVINAAMRADNGGFAGTWINPATGNVRLGVRGGPSATSRTTHARAARALADCGIGGNGDVVTVTNDAATLETASDWLGDRVVGVNA